MRIEGYIGIFAVIAVVSILYERYNKKFGEDDELREYHLVRKHLLNDNTVLKGKPIIWVHTDYKVNSRKWLDFKSRNTKDLNQKYIEMCVESIIKWSGESSNVCIINDVSFKTLIPGWTVDFNLLSDPIKSHMRHLAIAKVLYYYGGMLLPNSVLLLRDIMPLYKQMIGYKSMFVSEMVSKNITSSRSRFYPSNKIMGCIKNCSFMDKYVKKLELLISGDNTHQMDFTGQMDRYLYEMVKQGKIQLVDGKLLGMKTKDREVVLVDDLMNSSYVEFDRDIYGIYLPKEDILNRTKYNWFARLDRNQLYNANTIVSKYMVISHGK